MSCLLAKACLLSSRRRLQLCCLSELLSCLLAKASLLSSYAGLLNAHLADALGRSRLALLLLLEGGHGLRLRLAVPLRQEVGDRAGALIHEVALQFGALNAFTLSTKRP